jgi:hypothetical protein
LARAFLRGAFEFVVGDDLPTALGVVLSLGATALVASSQIAAWWLMPLAAVALLRWSLLRRVRLLAQPSHTPPRGSQPKRDSQARANSGSAPRAA